MFRLLYDHAVRLFTRSCSNIRTEYGDWALAQETRAPDPYVWRPPNPHDARWRRWARRNRAAGRYLPFPPEETCWQRPPRSQPPPRRAEDDPVRLYVRLQDQCREDMAQLRRHDFWITCSSILE